MLVQEETRLKNQGTHSVHLVSHQGAGKKYKKRSGKGIKRGPLKINESSTQIYNKDHKKDMCHFCRKLGHHKRDCLKCKAWFESKGILFNPNHKSKQEIESKLQLKPLEPIV
ncbi:Retrovirus-related Pol poly from transposon TNT 1-94 [Olea europaea subsp. europaea]|nr:Retrovirus-related Pol poly from transposon TNT 1-94 [Olea europaea subsp. europaea]